MFCLLIKTYVSFSVSNRSPSANTMTYYTIITYEAFHFQYILHKKVLNRVFTVSCYEGNTYITFPEFAVVYYIFHNGTIEEQFRFVFNCFDLSARGEVEKKDFRKFSLSMMQTEDKTSKQSEASEAKTKTLRSLVDMYANFGAQLYIRPPVNDDSVFRFSEWNNFAHEDEHVLLFVKCMGETADSSSSSSSSPSSSSSSSSSGGGGGKNDIGTEEEWTELLQ